MTRCTECETIEGYWLTIETQEEADSSDGSYEVGDEVCRECGSANCKQNIPEHDDHDMER